MAQSWYVHACDSGAVINVFMYLGLADGTKYAACNKRLLWNVKARLSDDQYCVLLRSLQVQMGWSGFEQTLASFAMELERRGKTATVLTYLNLMHSMHLIPRVSNRIAQAFQVGINKETSLTTPFSWPLRRPWTSFPLGAHEHHGFRDFAAVWGCLDRSDESSIALWHVFRALLFIAIADLASENDAF